MAKFDLKKLVGDSSDKLKAGAQKAQETLKGISDAAAKGKEMAELRHRKKEDVYGFITVDGAVKLMCMVMAADGDIADGELDQIREIRGELDPTFGEQQTDAVAESTALVKKLDAENYREDLNDLVRDVIRESWNVPGATIPVKLLLWDLLAVAQSDNRYQEEEAKLIRYIARHLEVDKSIVPEMENASGTLMAIENEIAWLKTTDRPFGMVEPVMNELSDRKVAIMQGVRDLIND